MVREVVSSRRLPPVAEVCVLTLVLVVMGGIYVAAKLPGDVPLALPFTLVIVAAALLLANIVMLSRVRPFAWPAFFLVAKWALLAYAAIAVILIYTFIRNDTPGDVMALLIAQLAVFAVNIPLLFAFSVARYQPAGPEG